MHNTSRGYRALSGLLLVVALLTSAFVIPQNVQAKTPADTDPQTPPAPSLLKAKLSGNLVLLYWNFNTFSKTDMNAPQRTIIYRSEGDNQHYKQLLDVPAVVALFSDSQVKAGVTYYYKVAFTRRVASLIPGAPPADVESADSNEVSIFFPNLLPTEKTVVQAQATLYGATLLSWNPLKNAIDYTIYRKMNDGAFSIIAQNILSTGYLDLDTQPSQQYVYYVVPRTPTGLAPSSDVASVSMPALVEMKNTERPPASPSNFLGVIQPKIIDKGVYLVSIYNTKIASPLVSNTSNVSVKITNVPVLNSSYGPQSILLSWNSSRDQVDTYQIWRSNSKGDKENYYQLIGTVSSTQTSYNDSSAIDKLYNTNSNGLADEANYWYRIMAVRGGRSIPLVLAPTVHIFVPILLTPLSFETKNTLIHPGENLRVKYNYTNYSQNSHHVISLTPRIQDSSGKVIYTGKSVPLSTTKYLVRPGETVPLEFDYQVSPTMGNGDYRLYIKADIQINSSFPGEPTITPDGSLNVGSESVTNFTVR